MFGLKWAHIKTSESHVALDIVLNQKTTLMTNMDSDLKWAQIETGESHVARD